MSFFRRADITVRCLCRGTTLAVPDRDALLDACEPDQRRRLQHALGLQPADAPVWSVHWGKEAGDALRPKEIVLILRRDGIIVEMSSAHRGVLAELLVPQGELVAMGAPLGRLERRARAAPTPEPAAPEPPANALLRHYVARQRQDAETIASLQGELATLHGRIAMLQGQRGERPSGDPKFKRLKHEFSRYYHPDARPAGDADQLRRARVFQEFWPIVEEIERS